MTGETSDIPTAPPLSGEDEIVHVFCTRCLAEDSTWTVTRSGVPNSVKEHVTVHHAPNGVGPSRPSGRPVWIEGDDWWILEDDV